MGTAARERSQNPRHAQGREAGTRRCRAQGYPVLFSAPAALITAIPNATQVLPAWLPAGILVVIAGAIEHKLAVMLGYIIPSTN
jgi:hypothetical protein